MNPKVINITLLIALGISIFLFKRKFDQQKSSIDKRSQALSPLRKILPANTILSMLVSNFDPEILMSSRGVLAPIRIQRVKEETADTILYAIPNNVKELSTFSQNNNREIFWSGKDDDVYYFLTVKK